MLQPNPFNNFYHRRWLRRLLDFDLAFLNGKYPRVSRHYAVKIARKSVAPLRSLIFRRLIHIDRTRAARRILSIPDLNKIYQHYRKISDSGGVEPNDYIRIYESVRRLKPEFVLECGTGLTTTAIGTALLHNALDYNIQGHLISMEENRKWYDHAVALLPNILSKTVSIFHSPKVVREVSGYKGVCYDEIPKHPYNFVFIDGPTESSPLTGEVLFDMDFMFVARTNPLAIGMIDHRLNSIQYLKPALKASHKVYYHPISKLGYILPKRQHPLNLS
jgi:hypothetical protein